jgi:MFS family permease
MLSALRPVRSLFVAVFMLMAGAGFIGSLTSLRLELAGVPALQIGAVATAYFLGLIVGSLRAPEVVRRVGHIRAFAAFVGLLSASTLAYGLHQDPWFWFALRTVDGFCVAGVYVCIESWLSDRTGPESRGAALASYMIALYSGQALAQSFLTLAGAPIIPFVAASILVSLSVLPVALTRSTSPVLGRHPTFPLRRLYAVSPLAFVGVGVTGIVLGAFYGLGAVYAQRLGLSLNGTASFMGAVIAGGVALQWPLGWLSDRMDRRKVIVGTLAGVFAVAVALALNTQAGLLLLALGAVFGGLSFALYPLCVGHANDHLTSEERVPASGQLVLVYSAGAVLGPLAGGAALSSLGNLGFFGFIAACVGGAFAFALWRLAARVPVPAELQRPYQVLPRTTPVSAGIDQQSPSQRTVQRH